MTQFEDFVRASGADLVRFARAVTGDAHRGEDAAQTALSKALPRWHRIGDLDDPVAYLKKMIVNGELSWRRRLSSRELVVEQVPSGAEVADVADAAVRRQALLERLRRLPPRQRAAVALRFYEDLPDREVAVLLGCTESTVRSLVAAALSALRLDEAAAARREEVANDANRR